MAVIRGASVTAICTSGSLSSGTVVVVSSFISFGGRDSKESKKCSRLRATVSFSNSFDRFFKSSAVSSNSRRCSLFYNNVQGFSRRTESTDEVRAEVSEETHRFSPRSIGEEKEDPKMSTDCVSKPVTNFPVPDIRGGVVALGKFDALHIGHRALAEQAARMGPPVLLSFSGMGEVLGWAPRLPVAALCDRKRIMSIWAKRCGGVIPQEYALDFIKVRSLSPKEFVRKLATELQVSGVVAGANYRFGYKAAGDASDLVHLCNEYGLQAFIVDPVMDTSEVDFTKEEMAGLSREKGQVSSTRVRKALAKGDLERVGRLLGRKHRLVITLENARRRGDVLLVPVRNALNQPPKEGCYDCTVVRTGEPRENVITASSHSDSSDEVIGVGKVKIGPEDIEVSLIDNSTEQLLERALLGLEFPHS
ncbi:hypothetical protein R1sor_002321 [Riccia sorocarpa]|uniref:FAD synthase n=1 Tax=Riccia sorocarpa TaxID=122646 RepID=A0ABD3H153_9MARC